MLISLIDQGIISKLKYLRIFLILLFQLASHLSYAQLTIDKYIRSQVHLDEKLKSISIGTPTILKITASDFAIHYYSGEKEEITNWQNLKLNHVYNQITITSGSDSIIHLQCELSFFDPIPELKEIYLRFHFLPQNPELWEEARNDFHWIPNIKSKSEHMASDHVFRSPVVIMMADSTGVAVIPDLDLIKQNRPAPYYLDMRFIENESPQIEYGIAHYMTEAHQYYFKTGEPFLPCNNRIQFGCYLIVDHAIKKNQLLRKAVHFLWNKYGESYLSDHTPQTVPFSTYAHYGYDMALKELWVDGPVANTGGITLSTYLDTKTKKWRGRSFPNDLWFHSWFNNMRTAYGLYLWGNKLTRPEWKQKAMHVANLLLESPRKNGLFDVIYKSHDTSWQASGQGGGRNVYHLPDNAWTAYWLLRFTQDCQPVENADGFLLDFTKGLLELQNRDGSFPTRVFTSALKADSILNGSASEALAIWFLAEMRLHNKISFNLQAKIDRAIQTGLDHMRHAVLPRQKFEDFELYFSCSWKPLNFYDPISEMYGQNTLSIQWCAEAFRTGYLLFNRSEDYQDALYCADLLCLYQQVWNPYYLSFHAFGGFGVMNTDAEWNDARQAQFSETLANFYRFTGNIEYLQRAVAAAKASFTLMVMEENRQVAPRNYQGTERQFEIHGAMAENYGHEGYNIRSHQSGFHWGTGSALCTAAILQDQFGDLYLDPQLKHAIGINGVVIKNVAYDQATLSLSVDTMSNDQGYSGKIKQPDGNSINNLIINSRKIAIRKNGSFIFK
jgi:hypothetical protein